MRVSISRSIAVAFAAGLAAVMSLPAAASADSPKTRTLELRDECEPVSFNALFGAGFCTRTGSGVSADRFLAELERGGHGAWWIRQREITLDQGDSIRATDVGGVVHTFTEVSQFGKGCVPQFNTAVKETVDNCDFGRLGATIVPQGATSAPEKLSLGTHRFQCLFHPWMRSVVTVRK